MRFSVTSYSHLVAEVAVVLVTFRSCTVVLLLVFATTKKNYLKQLANLDNRERTWANQNSAKPSSLEPTENNMNENIFHITKVWTMQGCRRTVPFSDFSRTGLVYHRMLPTDVEHTVCLKVSKFIESCIVESESFSHYMYFKLTADIISLFGKDLLQQRLREVSITSHLILRLADLAVKFDTSHSGTLWLPSLKQFPQR